jgi:hypothetical protein
MYNIEAIITTATPTELKFTANWPIDWLQAPETSTEVLHKLLPGEILSPPSVPLQQMELLGNRAFRPNLQLGDHVIVRCFFKGESR